jgi:WD40 repeat protein
VDVWDVSSGKRIAKLKGHEDQVLFVAFSPNGRLLASGDVSYGGIIRVWDTNTWREQRRIAAHRGFAHWLAFSADSKLLLSAGLDDFIKVWDPLTGKKSAFSSAPA